MTVQDAFEIFISKKELKDLSEETIKDYGYCVGVFLDYVGRSLDISCINQDIVDKYILYLLKERKTKQHRRISHNTRRTYMLNMRIFLTWINDNLSPLDMDPRKIELPRSKKKEVMILSENDTQALFDYIKKNVQAEWMMYRDYCLITLMLDSGLRVNELTHLSADSVNSDYRYVHVTGKGEKQRLVPVGETFLYLLSEYTVKCPYSIQENIFIAYDGRPLTKSGIQTFIWKIKHNTGLDLSCHKLRHNFATNFCIDNYERTGNTGFTDLGIIMGHSSLETTKGYEHFAHEILAVRNNHSHLDKIKYSFEMADSAQ